jgi:hypothetical protein
MGYFKKDLKLKGSFLHFRRHFVVRIAANTVEEN